jgi:protein-S-isoprenylcysteine O-methyltransferase Ste14
MQDWFLHRAQRSYSSRERKLVLLPAAFIFLGALPALIVSLGRVLDQRLHLPRLVTPPLLHWLARAAASIGVALSFWATAVQVQRGRGTPLPVMPTQELIAAPPYTFCRNPMALGTVLAYMSLALLKRSWGTFATAACVCTALLAEIRLWEEPELAARFGNAYGEYHACTPFLIPRVRRSQR